jgi:hypothetical protein
MSIKIENNDLCGGVVNYGTLSNDNERNYINERNYDYMSRVIEPPTKILDSLNIEDIESYLRGKN